MVQDRARKAILCSIRKLYHAVPRWEIIEKCVLLDPSGSYNLSVGLAEQVQCSERNLCCQLRD
jgi:hypothetical protein